MPEDDYVCLGWRDPTFQSHRCPPCHDKTMPCPLCLSQHCPSFLGILHVGLSGSSGSPGLIWVSRAYLGSHGLIWGLPWLIWSHLPPLQSLQMPLRARIRWQNSQPWSSSTGCLEKVQDRDRNTWEGPWVAKFRMGMPEGEACNDSCRFFKLGQDGMRLHENSSRGLPGRPQQLADNRVAI